MNQPLVFFSNQRFCKQSLPLHSYHCNDPARAPSPDEQHTPLTGTVPRGGLPLLPRMISFFFPTPRLDKYRAFPVGPTLGLGTDQPPSRKGCSLPPFLDHLRKEWVFFDPVLSTALPAAVALFFWRIRPTQAGVSPLGGQRRLAWIVSPYSSPRDLTGIALLVRLHGPWVGTAGLIRVHPSMAYRRFFFSWDSAPPGQARTLPQNRSVTLAL